MTSRMVVVMRHGDALRDAARDSLRPLSVLGRREVLANAQRMKISGIVLTRILSSSCVRALQTAEIVAACFGHDAVIDAYDEFCPDADVAVACALLERMTRTGETILLACHEPIANKIARRFGARRGPFATAEYQLIEILSEP